MKKAKEHAATQLCRMTQTAPQSDSKSSSSSCFCSFSSHDNLLKLVASGRTGFFIILESGRARAGLFIFATSIRTATVCGGKRKQVRISHAEGTGGRDCLRGVRMLRYSVIPWSHP